ncbi:Ig-like domain-containing protein [Serratia liquefaciens]|uniref:Ig-like domain-containing protein n=1 Tax=Serratia liquefaciens TaxID=614 RepID=UPI00382616E9
MSPADASNKTVVWSTSDAAKATVTSGKVTGIAAGTATITVTTEDGAKKATCTVTITAP